MNKKLLIVRGLVLLIITFVVFHLQCCREFSVVNTMSFGSGNGYTEDITIISNKLWILNKEKYCREIIQQCIDNNAPDVRFSYDVKGYPNELNLKIFKNTFYYKLGISEMEANYQQSGGEIYEFNIKDNPDKFKLTIK